MDANGPKDTHVYNSAAHDGDDPEHDAFQDVEDDGPMRSVMVAPAPSELQLRSHRDGGLAEDEASTDAGGRSLGEVGLNEVMASTSTHEAVAKRAPLEFGGLEKPVYRSVPGIEQPLGELALGPPPSLIRADLPKTASGPGTGRGLLSQGDIQVEAPGAPGGADFRVPDLQEYYRLDKTHVALDGDRDARKVVAKVHASLEEHDVDFEFKGHKGKWKCCHASNACMVEFVIRLWLRRGSSVALVVEFQRRSGDHAKLLQIFHGTLAILGAEAPRGTAGAGLGGLGRPPAVLAMPSAAAGGLLPPPALVKASEEEEALSKTIRHLMEMVSGGLVDAALQGARALAQFSMDKDLAVALHQAGVVRVLIQFLETPANFGHVSTMARTFAVACIANMSEEPMVQSSLYEGTGLLLSLVDEGTFADRAMRREAARTLRNLAQDSHGADNIIRVVGRDELEAWCRHKFPLLADPQMRTDVADVKLNLERRWQACN